jgi:hypothetical protein
MRRSDWMTKVIDPAMFGYALSMDFTLRVVTWRKSLNMRTDLIGWFL